VILKLVIAVPVRFHSCLYSICSMYTDICIDLYVCNKFKCYLPVYVLKIEEYTEIYQIVKSFTHRHTQTMTLRSLSNQIFSNLILGHPVNCHGLYQCLDYVYSTIIFLHCNHAACMAMKIDDNRAYK
jgi:hypothetical protein